ncbi:MAG TPA: ABC transporter permease [Bacillota bacterium]
MSVVRTTPQPSSLEPPRDEVRRRLERRRERLISTLSPLMLLVLWELSSRLELIDIRFFSRPSWILMTLVSMAADGELFRHIGISLLRVMLGFLLAAVPGVLMGLSMGLFRPVRAALEPIIAALYPIPKLALLPLLLLIFGHGEMFKVMTIGLGCVLLIAVNTFAGVANINPIYLDVARNFGASRRDYYLTIALPGALPMIFTGLKLGMGVALLLIVAAEMIGAQSGIGYLIWTSYQVFALEQMYVGLILMAFFGYVSTSSINLLERWLVPWQHD